MPTARSRFDAIYRQTSGAVWSFLRTSLRHEEAEEAFQEVFVALYRSLPGGDPEHPRAYTLTIARREAARIRRDRCRQPTAPMGVDDVAVEDPSPVADVGAALERLAPDWREVFLLRHQGGLRYEEIAIVLGIPVGTVASRLHQAIGALRRMLLEETREESLHDL